MEINGRFITKKAYLSGDTIRLRFQITDEDAPFAGFVPDTLVLSIYDVEQVCPLTYSVTCPKAPSPDVRSVIVNAQGTDVLGFCDSSGNVLIHAYTPDTDIDTPVSVSAHYHQRRFLFQWTWDGSPMKRASCEIFVPIAPDRATVAA